MRHIRYFAGARTSAKATTRTNYAVYPHSAPYD